MQTKVLSNMLDTFKAQLKAYLTAKKVNLSTKRIDAYAAKLLAKNPDTTEAADIDKLILEMDEVADFADIAKSDDQIRTLSSKKPVPPKSSDDPAPPADDEPEWKKELTEMKQALAQLNKERSQQTIQEKVKGHEKLKGIPASFLKGRSLPDSPDAIDTYVEEVSADYAAFKQELANEGFAQSSRPGGGSGIPAKGDVSPEVKAFAEKNLKKPVNN